MGIQPEMVEGRRITNAETLEVVEMYYAGKLNKQIVALLQSFGLDAEGKETILLNSHHDTVKPGNWTYNPFEPTLEGDKLIGLGSNDAGGPLVSLMATFLYLKDKELPYNLIFAASAEEEISGANGMRALYSQLGKIDLAIVGEPTKMDLAIAERGLIVADCTTKGKTGHAARNEGVNALYLAIDDINWLRSYQFDKVSEVLGPVSINVTKIESGTQHNVIPDHCNYLVDIRTNELYNNLEIIEFLKKNLNAEFSPRSYWLNSSGIPIDHPFVQKAKAKGFKTYGSPTLSDQSLMDCHSVKIGPGDSARSHTPDEYILISEIEEGIDVRQRFQTNR
ncbi:unnamed protein product [Cyprideis torosa]|uniref:Peptidase M20 dimerisation domain-containing protein n=1 Tax=Cyprideis torosa TaxID=163714 RepID=A0A7R8WFA0_9CRUS|nr:unnamed protein product [Cyprideis torosa]CAG0895228.1 unnamed protein product [Cyprideis torosa]